MVPTHVAAVPAPAAWTPRGEQYPETVKRLDLSIPMSDGLSLEADLILPADANKVATTEPLPVVVQITAYNKAAVGYAGGLGGSPPDYLVKRGYAYLMVDVRGTGTSPGTWQVFGAREQQDAAEVMEWAADQPWSNGSTAMVGPSYMGITQLFAAGRNPRGLKAIFPQVPSADVYRDITASGGQLDVGFMPLWLGLVTFTSLIPSPGTTDPLSPVAQVLARLTGTGAPSLQLALDALAGGEKAYDGPWYRERSTLLQAVPHIDVPTFLVGGHYDLFQRGTPMVFQALQERGVPVKMVLGPWDHLEGSSAAEIGEAGYGSIAELQLRWFDHYVRGVPDPSLDSDIPDFTYYELGSGRWVRRDDYLDEQVARVFSLSGTAVTAARAGTLTEGQATTGRSTVLPVAAAGLCSRSSSQWTGGVAGTLPVPNPCDTDNRANDATGVVFETGPLERPLRMLGPLNARLYASSTTGDGLLSVHVSRVDPSGTVERLTGGWQVISLAALDTAKSLALPDTADRWTRPANATTPTEIVQPRHPFTPESRRVRAPGEITPVDVEVFPTGAVVPAGHRLRMSVNAYDLPHLAPTLQQLPTLGSVLTIHSSPSHPSRLVVPTFGRARQVTAPPVSPTPGTTPGTMPGTTPGAPLPATPGTPAGDPDTSATSVGSAAVPVGGSTAAGILPDTGAPAHLWDLAALGLGLVLAGHTLTRVRRHG